MTMRKLISLFSVGILLAGCTPKPPVESSRTADAPYPARTMSTDVTEPQNSPVSATIVTNLGDIALELADSVAPQTVANFVRLSDSDFYNGTRFHRVMNNFMIQGGDPLSKAMDKKKLWGTGGPGYAFADEINQLPLVRGSLAMANSGPNTNGSQFFIISASSTPWLDGKHTNFGRVVAGMEVVEKISRLPTDDANRPLQDVVIERIEITPGEDE